MTIQLLTETLDLSETAFDTENRTLRGVVLIRAGTSKNRRHYSETVLQSAAPVFENAPAYADHPTKPGQGRSIREFTGQYKNVRYENGALRADRVFARTQAGMDAYAIAQDILEGRITPDVAGLSINAVGSGKNAKHDDGDVFEVESITKAASVDDVAQPAAGGSYRESVDDNLIAAAIEGMEYLEWYQMSTKHIERHAKELKTIRQDEAVKAAKAEADTLKLALEEAQAKLEALQSSHEAAVKESEIARRELAAEKRIAGVNVPKDWLKDLRERLVNASDDQWASIVENEEAKAKAAGHRVAVTNAGQQVSAPIVEATKPKAPQFIPIDQFESPDQLAAYISQVRIS